MHTAWLRRIGVIHLGIEGGFLGRRGRCSLVDEYLAVSAFGVLGDRATCASISRVAADSSIRLGRARSAFVNSSRCGIILLRQLANASGHPMPDALPIARDRSVVPVR